MSDLSVKRILAQLRKAESKDDPNLIFLPNESNIRICHVLVVGLGYPYLGAEIILRLEMPEEFPRKPPELRCLTENGVYMVGGKICISIGEFHAGDRTSKDGASGWRPAEGLIGFAKEALNGIIVPETLNAVKHPDSGLGGLGILDTDAPTRQTLALLSSEYNRERNGVLMETYEKYAASHPGLGAVKAWRRQQAMTRIRLRTTRRPAPELFTEAFPELVDWCPRLAQWDCPHAHLEEADRLIELGDTPHQKAHLLAGVIGTAGEKFVEQYADVWLEELCGCLSVLNGRAPSLRRRMDNRPKLKECLQDLIMASARQNFMRRDELLAAFRTDG